MLFFVHVAVALGGDDELFADGGAQVLEGLAHDAFGLAVVVDVGGVDEVGAVLDGGADHRGGGGLVGGAAEGHGAQGERGDADAGSAEVTGLHGGVSLKSVVVAGGGRYDGLPGERRLD